MVGGLCLVHFSKPINQTGMTKALKCSIQKLFKHRHIIKDLLSRQCTDTNTFMMLYGEVGIAIHEYIDYTGLSAEGLFYDEHTPTNAALANSYLAATISLFRIYCHLMQGG